MKRVEGREEALADEGVAHVGFDAGESAGGLRRALACRCAFFEGNDGIFDAGCQVVVQSAQHQSDADEYSWTLHFLLFHFWLTW